MPQYTANFSISGNIDITVEASNMEKAIELSEIKVREIMADAIVRSQYIDYDLDQLEELK